MHTDAEHLAETIVHADAPSTEPVTGWHALAGLPVGTLRGASPAAGATVHVDAVLEATPDLAVADRVAWAHAARTGRTHVVLATGGDWLVATVDAHAFTWADATRLAREPHAPTIVSVAQQEGVMPVLVPAAG